MKTPLRLSRYCMDGGVLPNAQAKSSQVNGVIVEFNGGYGCMQAWSALGDCPLEFHLESLREGNPTSMGKACLNCCQIDGDARRAGVNLLKGLILPRSHYLFSGFF